MHEVFWMKTINVIKTFKLVIGVTGGTTDRQTIFGRSEKFSGDLLSVFEQECHLRENAEREINNSDCLLLRIQDSIVRFCLQVALDITDTDLSYLNNNHKQIISNVCSTPSCWYI